MSGLVVDLFAGGGGASVGIERALGRSVDIAINHDETALAVHRANHPGTRHLEADIWEVRPLDATGGRPVDLLWASPDCTHFSVAKGDVPRSAGIRSLAWAVVRWAKAVRPRVILLENVREFQGWGPLGPDRKPNKARAGSTFRAWVGKLERLGYAVEWRVLDASAYGAPTRRRRLFVAARCDGLPIVWPEPTHGIGRLPYRTAAECIDWSIPCPSIFERKKPLAEKTLWRIAEGIRRYVLEAARPFLVQVNHSGSTGRSAHVWPVDESLRTVAASNGFAVAVPSLVEMTHSNAPRGVDEPLGVVTTQGNRFNVVAPVIARYNGTEPFRGQTPEDPLTTLDCSNRFGVVAPTLVQTGYGERDGQRPRALDLHAPLGTCVNGQKHALVSAFLAKHFGGVVGHAMDERVATVTARDHHSLAAATLLRFNHDDHGVPLAAPLPTVTAKSMHIAEVCAFLTAYYREGTPGQSLFDPLRTVTTKHRLGLVTIDSVEYQIVDIGMRMLEPHELLRAQFGDFAESYDLGAARTKSAKVRLIGNSVAPAVAEALVRANVVDGVLVAVGGAA